MYDSWSCTLAHLLDFFYFMEPENLQEFTNVLRGRFYNVMDFYSLIGW